MELLLSFVEAHHFLCEENYFLQFKTSYFNFKKQITALVKCIVQTVPLLLLIALALVLPKRIENLWFLHVYEEMLA